MQSPDAAKELKDAIGSGMSPFSIDADDLVGQTDCLNGCQVEPDGRCPHGFDSAGVTAGLI